MLDNSASPFQAELDIASLAARAAGSYLRDSFRSVTKVVSEVGRDIKLQVDSDAEEVILSHLQLTAHSILSEERGEIHCSVGSSLQWVVDPLDGSANFARGLDLCAVSIALCRADEPLVAVVYSFMRDEMFHAVQGRGAFLNGESIHVSTLTSPAKSFLATGLATKGAFDEVSLDRFAKRLSKFKKIRLIGSAALSLAYVASGRLDAYCEDGIMWWDVAAGILLVREAGGWVEMSSYPELPWGRVVRAASSQKMF